MRYTLEITEAELESIDGQERRDRYIGQFIL
jgi:hypothetical protein